MASSQNTHPGAYLVLGFFFLVFIVFPLGAILLM
jgi:hypothetical protein